MIIGITGTDGAGKGAAVNYLVRKKGFRHYSSREEISAEIRKRDLADTRANLRTVANDMRHKYGNDILVARALKRIEVEGVKDSVVESVRAIAEMETLKQAGGVLLAIDANPKERYRRIQGRKSGTDKVSYQEFLELEQVEMNDPNPHGMQKAAVMESADYTIMNDYSIKQLHKKIDSFLNRYAQS